MAVDAAKMMAKPKVNTREIGKKIESIIKGFKYNPIKELGGHQTERWIVHGKKALPELGNQKGDIMEEGDVFAVEIFASTGEGSVHLTNNSFIYELNPYSGRVPLRRKASKNLETYEDVKIEQGKIQAYDKVLGLPDKIISFVREKEQKRAIEQK